MAHLGWWYRRPRVLGQCGVCSTILFQNKQGWWNGLVYIQVIVAKLSDLSSVPRTHVARTNFCMLSFDLHLHTGVHESPQAHTHINTIKRRDNTWKTLVCDKEYFSEARQLNNDSCWSQPAAHLVISQSSRAGWVSVVKSVRVCVFGLLS